ncbi:class I SAM-dependent methyltransferase [Stutzerimonas kunmingensis]|uniref:class I SAM-dependent methyltransferase n=1 Tax=Stutzerimonas kunmingensis TaxID=1211807 RepID=UPI00241FCC9C|nr:class I SAM-dependent methyltransferase [Stutzerimonas kunmingensis]
MFRTLTRWLRGKPTPAPLESKEPALANAGNLAPASEENHSHPVAYDENLLERSRTQWQFGDWASLAKLERSTLQHHPDRAKLALLAAAGHQQLGNEPAVRQFTQLALEWGCGKKLASQLLIAGVHNTLGRAAGLDQGQERALQHFERAIGVAMPSADQRLLARVRAGEEFAQLGLPAPLEVLPAGRVGSTRIQMPALGGAMQAVAEQLQKQNAELSQQLTKQGDDLIKVRKYLEGAVKKEILNATQQLEAYLGVQSFLNHGERIPGMHGWPISPDFALYLIELIDSNDYDLIIEFGSGTSTVVMAKALARIAPRRQKAKPLQVAFEHLEQYHAQTQANLQQAGLADAVQLVLAPLEPYTAPNGNTYPYYSCHAALADLASQLPMEQPKVLVMVDGPPASTGKHARYAAVPAVLAHFQHARLDILLDDYIRDDEKEIAQLWLTDIETLGLSHQMKTQKMEKDACLISVNTPAHTEHP